MPNFAFDYTRIKSTTTGLFINRPMIPGRLMQLSDPSQTACPLNFRVDSGADYSAVSFSLAREVLDLPGSTDAQVLAELKRESKKQFHLPIPFIDASGTRLPAYPLTVPIEIVDKHGAIGIFEALIAFPTGQRQNNFLAGLSGFLDKFDLHFRPKEFALHARPGSNVTCQHPFAAGRANSIP